MYSDSHRSLKSEVADTLVLAGPIIVTQLASISMGFVDTVMVGRLGPSPLAAVALGNTIFFSASIFGMGIMNAVSPMVSQAYGANDPGRVGKSVRQGLWLGVLVSIPFVFIIRNIWPALLQMGQDPATVASAREYIHAMAWGLPAFLLFIGLRSFVEGVGRPRPATFITIVGVGLNVLANYVLMYGHLGFPALGLVGTGWASTIVFWFNFISLFLFCNGTRYFSKLAAFRLIKTPDLKFLYELFKLGLPIGLFFGVEATLFMFTALLMGLISTTALAAHQVAIQCAAFTFMVPLGIGLSAAVRVGHAAGRHDREGTRWAGFVGMMLAVSVMFVTAVCFWLFPRPIVGLYLDLQAAGNQDVISMAVALLGVAAVFQIFDGLQVAAAGALRGLKDTRIPMFIGIVGYWVCGLGSGYWIAFGLNVGPLGLWWGLVIGLAVAGVLLAWRFNTLSNRALER